MTFVPDLSRPVYGNWTFGWEDGQATMKLDYISDPLAIPVLDMDFTTGILDSKITFTRASTATYIGSDGLIKSAAINAPRFGYNPTNLAARGLLMEPSATNNCTYSDDWTNAAWLKTNSSINANAITAPDGSSNADAILDNATAGTHTSQNTMTPAATTTYTYSIWLKKGANQYVALQVAGGGIGTNIMASIDFNTGLTTTLNGTPVSHKAIAYLNGWYRMEVVFTTVTTSLLTFYINGLANNTFAGRSYTGTGAIIAYVWGAQLEVGTYATSYIPTVAAAVTRSADSAVMSGANFNWFNPTEGTFAANFTANDVGASNSCRVLSANDNTNNNRIEMLANNANQEIVFTANVGQASIDGGDFTALALNKCAMCYKANDFAVSLNGAAVAIDTTGTIPAVTQLQLGANPSGGQLNGWIQRLRYWNNRRPNSELVTLST